jgi:TM2 domain-containing membrane protein YozV
MKKYYYISICLCAVFIQNSWGQSADTYSKTADSYYRNHDFEMAELYYSRAAYEENNSDIQTQYIFKRIEILLQNKQAGKAFKVINAIPLDGLQDSTRIEVLYKSALCAFFSEDYIECNAKLLLLEQIYPNQQNSAKVKILNVLLLNEQGQYEAAREKLLSYISTDSSLSNDLQLIQLKKADSIYLKSQVPKLVNEKKAITLNIGSVGFGYFYAGYIGEGISSFIFQTSGLGLAALAFVNGYYATGILAPLTIYNYFHGGSIKRIEYLVTRDNYKKKRKFNLSAKPKIITLLK